MKAPLVMGCPLWTGKIKRRVAKKYLDYPVWKESKFLEIMAEVKVGDLINDCSAFNVRVTEIEPRYYHIGSSKVLMDIDITNAKGGSCSFVHCGVTPARTREDILSYWEENVKYWLANGDVWDFAKRYEFTKVESDGQATIDYKGLKEKYGI